MRRPSSEIIRPVAVIRFHRRRAIVGRNGTRHNNIFFENFAIPVLPGYRICFHSGVVRHDAVVDLHIRPIQEGIFMVIVAGKDEISACIRAVGACGGKASAPI